MTGEEVYGAIEHFASYSVLLPALVCLIRIKALNLTLWALFIYLGLCFIIDQIYLALLPDQTNANRFINCWTIVECFFFCFIYFREAKNRFFKRSIVALFFCFSCLSFLTFYQNLSIEDKVVSATEAGIIIAVSVCMFIEMIFDGQTGPLVKNYYFWINCALLMYFCTAIFIFIENDQIIYLSEQEPKKAQQIWVIHDVIGIFCNLLISFGITLWKRTRIQS